ncbi:virulence factor TspB C-terminal domain-related protein [Methylomonas sp. CM2]|uniref:virulence factor TspB C-terminal domain-related protein n=1 Tax=Methylomonas sp. CM2 TaxID=3417647 RepID=UPI003CF4281A
MDRLFLILLFFFISSASFAGPVVSLFSVSRAGTASTVRVGAAASSFPAAVAKVPAGAASTGVAGIGVQAASNGAQYRSNVINLFPDLNGPFTVSNAISASSIASSAASLLTNSRLNPWIIGGTVLWGAGNALWDYYHNAGVSYDPETGQYGLIPLPITDALLTYTAQNLAGVSSSDPVFVATAYMRVLNTQNGLPNCDVVGVPAGYNANACLVSVAIDHLGVGLAASMYHLLNKAGNNFFGTHYYLNSTRGTTCPVGYTYSSLGEECYLTDPNPAVTPATTSEVEQRLNSAPSVSPQKQADTIAEIGKVDPAALPTGDAPVIESVPAPETTAPQTSVSPDGAVQTTTKTVTATKTGPQTATVTEMTSVKTTPASSIETTVNIENAPSPVVLSGSSPSSSDPAASQSQTDCDKYPDILACQKVQTPTLTMSPLLTKDADIPADLDNHSFGNPGSCPTPPKFTLYGKEIVMSLDFICGFLIDIRPVILLLGYLFGALIIFRNNVS